MRAVFTPGANCNSTPYYFEPDCQYVNATCFAPGPLPYQGTAAGMGAGTILLLVLLVGLALYCVGGAAFKIATGAESAFPQVLPHWDLWRRLFSRISGSGRQRGDGAQAGETTVNNLLTSSADADENIPILNVIGDASAEVGNAPSTPRAEP
eukprot:TRINITY_DN1119_c0_g1_i2.p2 TRINITY_DN1119_c0_g1~~TRINITY_DN1119_c0_g1_i2.p2  ORF type:complete len:152 (+),score=18.20 TRINITY_DN1119_c0_g1_i2:232-687(+)